MSDTEDHLAQVTTGYQEHHCRDDLHDVGVAFDHNRVWVCVNGQSVFRAKVMPGGSLFVEFYGFPEHEKGAA